MKSQFHKTRFWALFLVLYLFLGAFAVSKLDNSTISFLWVVGLIVLFIIMFVQIRKTDKVIAQNKEFKKEVSNNLKTYLKFFIMGEGVLFLVFVAYLLILRFFNIDISVWRIIIEFVVITLFYWILYKKGILGFLSPKKVERYKKQKTR